MRVLLVNPPLRSITNRVGVGFQLPLGLVMVGGPLVDAGHQVTLCDADALGLSPRGIAATVARTQSSVVLVGHSGSTAANPTSIEVMAAVKAAVPSAITVYGGVYPTYAADVLLERYSQVDVIVRGEGEATVAELVSLIASGGGDFEKVRGITWRDLNGRIRRNPDREPIVDLDPYRVAWELADWSLYKAFGTDGAAAGIQFSRGCPRTCTYCGQWAFWKRWRHRSINRFVNDLQLLHDRYNVRSVWIADENWGDDPELLHAVLAQLAERQLDLAIYCSMCASDVARDIEHLALYRKSGIRFILMGVESANDEVLQRIGKDNPQEMVKTVATELRKNGILSVVNYIFGIQPETHRSMWQSLKRIFDLDADFINALYYTPHGWTLDGRRTDPAEVVQFDQTRWSYRNQVIDAGGLTPAQFFLWIKLIEAAAHLRPTWLSRLVRREFPDVQRLLRWCFIHTSAVWVTEIYEQLAHVRFHQAGRIQPDLARLLLPSGQRGSSSSIHPQTALLYRKSE